MADSEQQVFWTREVEHLLASSVQPTGEVEHILYGWESRVELLRNLAAHALTGGQPLVASSIYQQVAEIEEKIHFLRRGLTTASES
jgi:hypothetical protein